MREDELSNSAFVPKCWGMQLECKTEVMHSNCAKKKTELLLFSLLPNTQSGGLGYDYHRIAALAQVKPLPNEARTTRSPS